jgi:hypothetical protein
MLAPGEGVERGRRGNRGASWPAGSADSDGYGPVRRGVLELSGAPREGGIEVQADSSIARRCGTHVSESAPVTPR